MTEDKKEIYAKAFEMLLSEIEERIDDKATEMYNEGAYIEEDEDDGSHRAYRMTRSQCRQSAIDDFLMDDKNWAFMYNFLNFCAAQINQYHVMDKTNPYHNAYL